MICYPDWEHMTYPDVNSRCEDFARQNIANSYLTHKTIAVTMQVYNHALFERKQSEVARIPSALAV